MTAATERTDKPADGKNVGNLVEVENLKVYFPIRAGIFKTVQGTVKAFNYTNPHSWLQVLAADETGQTKEWSFEMEGPSTLMRAGIKPGSLKPGDKITVRALPSCCNRAWPCTAVAPADPNRSSGTPSAASQAR